MIEYQNIKKDRNNFFYYDLDELMNINLNQFEKSSAGEKKKKSNTVKPVLRGHLVDKEKWSYKTGDLLKEVQFI